MSSSEGTHLCFAPAPTAGQPELPQVGRTQCRAPLVREGSSRDAAGELTSGFSLFILF